MCRRILQSASSASQSNAAESELFTSGQTRPVNWMRSHRIDREDLRLFRVLVVYKWLSRSMASETVVSSVKVEEKYSAKYSAILLGMHETNGTEFVFVHLLEIIDQYGFAWTLNTTTHCTATRPSTPPTVYPEAVGVTATHLVWNLRGESIGAPVNIVGLFRSTKQILYPPEAMTSKFCARSIEKTLSGRSIDPIGVGCRVSQNCRCHGYQHRSTKKLAPRRAQIC